MNVKIKNTNEIAAIVKANDKFNKLCEKFLTLEERELIQQTSDIVDINRFSIIFSILLNDYGLTVEQLNGVYKKADKIANDAAKNNGETFYKLNEQCQELKKRGVDIERLYEGG